VPKEKPVHSNPLMTGGKKSKATYLKIRSEEKEKEKEFATKFSF